MTHPSSEGSSRDPATHPASGPDLPLDRAPLATLAEAIEVPVLVLDSAARLLAFNSASSACFPLDSTHLGLFFAELPCFFENSAALRPALAQAVEGATYPAQELRTQDARWFRVSVRRTVAASGACGALVLSCVEITDARRMCERFALALDSADIAWWEWDVASDQITVRNSSRCLVDSAFSPEPLSRAACLEIVHPDDREPTALGLEAALRGDSAHWESEHRLRQKHGAWTWVRNQGRVVARDAHGRPLRMVGTTQNIDARKAAEASVARDLELLAHVPDAIVCVDVDGVVTYWNRAAVQLYGWQVHEVLGRRLIDRIPTQARAEFNLMLVRALDGRDHAGEFRDYRKDGSALWVDARAHRLLGPEGRVIGVMRISRDVTEARRQREQRAMMERQLAQSQKMETLGNLAGGIAHDFNNLLAAILGYAEIATDLLPEGHPALAKLSNVRQAGQRAAELVRRILAFSRANDQARRPVRVAQLVEETLPLLRASLPSTIEIRSVVTPDADHCVLGDSTQLQQVILNLCANAAHAIGDRTGGRLDLRLEPVELDSSPVLRVGSIARGPALLLTISDNGCGMTPAVMNRIFEPFFTTKPIGEGTGLGLSIAQTIITTHLGGIAVESTPGVGTVLRIYLPALPENVVETVRDGAPSLPSLTLPVGNGERVAVIDDEETVALLTQQVLERHGYVAEIMPDATTCLETIRANPDAFALVVTDQTMPLMTGLEMVQALRASSIQTPVLILSGYSRAFATERLSALGRVGFLAKPFVVRDLLERVHAIVHRPADAHNNSASKS